MLASDSDAHGAITVTVYPDRVLAAIRGIQVSQLLSQYSLGDGALMALVIGYQSWSTCHITALPRDATSCGAMGLTVQEAGWLRCGMLAGPGRADLRIPRAPLEAHPCSSETRRLHHVPLRRQADHQRRQRHHDRRSHLIRPVPGIRRMKAGQRDFGDRYFG